MKQQSSIFPLITVCFYSEVNQWKSIRHSDSFPTQTNEPIHLNQLLRVLQIHYCDFMRGTNRYGEQEFDTIFLSTQPIGPRKHLRNFPIETFLVLINRQRYLAVIIRNRASKCSTTDRKRLATFMTSRVGVTGKPAIHVLHTVLYT